MTRSCSQIKSILQALCLGLSLFACSLPTKIMPHAEFNALIVDADAAIHDGRWSVAIAKLDQAAVLQPSDLNVKLKQALVYQLSGKLAMAHNAYQQVIDATPNPTGKNIELVRAAKTNQAKLGFKPLDVMRESSTVDAEASESTSAEPAAITLAPDTAKALIEEVASVSSEVPAERRVETHVSQQIEAWRLAWQERRVDDYLSHYSSDFKGDFSSHAEWRKQRASRINAAKGITIEMAALQLEQRDADTAIARFIQTYQSAGHGDTGLKTLHLKRINNQWLITLEQFTKQ
jgi:tetratricopeptide (TPR) repeat protein